MTTSLKTPFRLALISMPWALFNRPSIQLGALKAYIEQDPHCQVDTFHPYLQIAKSIGIDRYREISLNSWTGEALFAPLLFPEKMSDAEHLFHEGLPGDKKSHPSFEGLSEKIDTTCTAWLDTIDLNQYDLIGFSICFSQLLPSLYLARKIKRQSNKVPIVFGGSSCSGAIGPSLLDHFPEIDFIVDGEGEESLLQLCKFIDGRTPELPAKVHSRKHVTVDTNFPEIIDMDGLPVPDYAPYFEEIQQLFPSQPFIPLLPVEFSRGCWWNKCTFCNLNLQWQGYRSKTGERIATEVTHLSQLHESLHFTFTDNALPPKETDIFFKILLKKNLDLDFFAEIRAISDHNKLQLYQQGGLTTVQVGIEALSTSLLKKMAKGRTVIDNMAVMKMCRQTGIQLEGNLITEFPGSTEEEVTETLANLDYILPFTPLQPATFFLGYGSPIHGEYKEFGIQAILPHPKNNRLYPKKYLQSMTMLVNGYRGDRTKQRPLWQPVKDKIVAWRAFHDRRTDSHTSSLHFRDGGTFIIIRQERLSGPPLQHRLRGLSRRLYLFCEVPKKIEDILLTFPGLTEKSVHKFVKEMCDKHLMFQEQERVLSLAIRHT